MSASTYKKNTLPKVWLAMALPVEKSNERRWRMHKSTRVNDCNQSDTRNRLRHICSIHEYSRDIEEPSKSYTTLIDFGLLFGRPKIIPLDPSWRLCRWSTLRLRHAEHSEGWRQFLIRIYRVNWPLTTFKVTNASCCSNTLSFILGTSRETSLKVRDS